MANGFMSPFGTQTTTPFLFGEDPASRQALESYQAGGDVAQQIIGLQDPRSPEAQQEMEMVGGTGPLEAFLPMSPIGGLRQLGGLQKLSRFGTPTPPKQLPVLRGGQQPVSTVSQAPSTLVRPTGTKRVDGTVVNPLTTTTPRTGGGIIPSLATLGLGGALVTDQLMQDSSQGQAATAPQGVTAPEGVTAPTKPKSPIEIHTDYLGLLKEQGVSDDERVKIAAQMIKPFISNRGERMSEYFGGPPAPKEKGETLAEFRARVEKGDEPQKSGTSEMSKGDFLALARQAGFKGSAVSAMAKQLEAEFRRKEAESKADIAAKEALTAAREAPKATTLEKDLADIESRFSQVGIPFRDDQGSLTEAARIALLQKGRISEIGTIGSGLELTDELARQFLEQAGGNKEEARRLATEAGFTVS